MLLLIIYIVVDTVVLVFVTAQARDACSALSVLESKNAQVGDFICWDLSKIASRKGQKVIKYYYLCLQLLMMVVIALHIMVFMTVLPTYLQN